MPFADSYLQIQPDVAEALAGSRPVVALESALVSHGLPWPVNLQTALAAEQAVRKSGSVPATVSVAQGCIRVGTSEDQLRALASRNDVEKANARDLASAVIRRSWAGTTVAATLTVAHRVGIAVMATGGIGGVHRGGALSFDVSNDLLTLARIPICVVCSGIKAVLDIGLTLEKLESYGVPVVGFGTDRLPGFLVRDTEFAVGCRVETVRDVAHLLRVHWDLGGKGVLVVQPPPEPALSEAEWYAALAVAEREAHHIRGKDVTPFLLQRIAHHTQGRSQEVNSRLLEANAALAGDIAAALSRFQ